MEINILKNYKENHKIDLKHIEEHVTKLKIVMHPVRYAIMVILVKNKKMTVSEIHSELSMQQAAVSNHLKLMKTNGILCSERDGQNIFYEINNNELRKLFECLTLRFDNE
ncbi:MAG TPA: metalloregulator ArsR/SmtB family transcription factor [Bacteroidales bacterium]|nr:metalloregulator ArsR/SmtB family transcription factor [Bacteroidales bacterium]